MKTLLLASLLLANPAQAEDDPCANEAPVLDAGELIDGATLPANAALWFGRNTPGAVSFSSPHDDEIPTFTTTSITGFTSGPLGQADTVTLRRADPSLVGGANYQVLLDGGGPNLEEWVFTVSEDEDHTPPALPIATPSDQSGGPTWSVSRQELRFDFDLEIGSSDEPLGLIVGILSADEDVDFDEEAADGVVSLIAHPDDSVLTVGRSSCGTNWPDAEEGDSTELRYGVYDLAGNFSGWSEPITLTVIEPEGCSCSASASRSSLFAGALLLLVGIRRRAR